MTFEEIAKHRDSIDFEKGIREVLKRIKNQKVVSYNTAFDIDKFMSSKVEVLPFTIFHQNCFCIVKIEG